MTWIVLVGAKCVRPAEQLRQPTIFVIFLFSSSFFVTIRPDGVVVGVTQILGLKYKQSGEMRTYLGVSSRPRPPEKNLNRVEVQNIA
jgi:hypothetical protein